jgi:hypothetical protein
MRELAGQQVQERSYTAFADADADTNMQETLENLYPKPKFSSHQFGVLVSRTVFCFPCNPKRPEYLQSLTIITLASSFASCSPM